MAYAVPVSEIRKIGAGVDQWNLRLKDFVALLYHFNVAAILYGFGQLFMKLGSHARRLYALLPRRNRMISDDEHPCEAEHVNHRQIQRALRNLTSFARAPGTTLDDTRTTHSRSEATMPVHRVTVNGQDELE
ncbi:hypothetical protein BDW62DRAFT_200784 [Aspergillus aurantiobrunneus]